MYKENKTLYISLKETTSLRYTSLDIQKKYIIKKKKITKGNINVIKLETRLHLEIRMDKRFTSDLVSPNERSTQAGVHH